MATPRSGNRILAFGMEAKKTMGRTPENMAAIRPIRQGTIHDFSLAEALLHACLERAIGTRSWVKPRVVASAAHGTDEVQRRAVADSARAAGCREVRLVDSIVAAALGCELPIQEPVGNLIIDIGAGFTAIGVLALGGVSASLTLPVAGDDLDAAISGWLRAHHNLLVGERTAEHIKLSVGCARTPQEPLTVEVTGRDLQSGIPREIQISNQEITPVIATPLEKIYQAIQHTLRQTPPELAADIYDHGIVLCGGTAKLPALDQVLRERTGLPVVIAPDPERCVTMGILRLIEDPALLERAIL